MEGTRQRRVLGTLISAALGFVVTAVGIFPIGLQPLWWVTAGVLGALFAGVYAAAFGTPWMREAR
jgi:hypothetical protein